MSPPLAVEVVEAGAGFALSAEQRRVLAAVVTSGRAVEAVVGPPGCGKTTLMRAARVAWESAGYTVAGAATQAVAAQALQAETGIASRTVASWRLAGLAGVDVLVLDEASLTEDRDRAWLYAEAARADTKLVEIGDPRQLRGVGCGSVFARVHELVGGPELTENRRQRDEDERAAQAAQELVEQAECVVAGTGSHSSESPGRFEAEPTTGSFSVGDW